MITRRSADFAAPTPAPDSEPELDFDPTDAAGLRREVAELRAEVVRLERELGIERGEHAKYAARAHEEFLRANAGWAACGRIASARMYQVRRIVLFPLRFARRVARAVVRRIRARRHSA